MGILPRLGYEEAVRPASLRAVLDRVAPDETASRGGDPVTALGALLDLRASVKLAERLAAARLRPAQADRASTSRLVAATNARLGAVRARLAAALAPDACAVAVARATEGAADPARAAGARVEELASRELARARLDVRELRDRIAERARETGGRWAEAERLDAALEDATRAALERRTARALAALGARVAREVAGTGGATAAPSLADARALALALFEADARRVAALAAVPLVRESV